MTELLIALGCSFTYGEGLSYELIADKYKHTHDYLKTLENQSKVYPYMFEISRCYNEFDIYRNEKKYPTLLGNLLNVNVLTNGQNGGSNGDRLFDIKYFFNFLNKEPEMIPKYCVFQITHSGRDIEKMLIPNGNQTTTDVLIDIYGESFYNKVNDLDMGRKNVWVLDNLFDEANHIFIKKLIETFDYLKEKYGTKCLFYMGLGDYNEIKNNYERYKNYPYFFELINDGKLYYTQLQMINELGWTFEQSLGIKDNHPNGHAHKWLAEQLYKKLTN
jgi:hypothetical protein